MPRLLSDIEGKIEHILITSPSIKDIPRIKNTLKTFDRDVSVTIVYPQYPSDDSNSYLQHLINEFQVELNTSNLPVPSVRNIGYLPVPNQPWMWPQDLILVQEDGTILPSKNLILDQRGELKKSQQDIEDIVSSPYWEKRGFKVEPDSTGLSNVDGGDLIVFGDTIFVGSHSINEHFYSSRKVKYGTKISEENYRKVKDEFLVGLKALDSERKFRVMEVGGEPLAHHLTSAFTPIDEDTVVIADINSTLEFLNVPNEILVVPSHRKLSYQLDTLTEELKLEYENVFRVPMVPRLYIPKRDHKGTVLDDTGYYSISQNINHIMNYNNVVQERYIKDGNRIHRVRIPLYTMPEHVSKFGMDILKFEEIQKQAVEIYRKLGLQVQTVQFKNIVSYDGGLDCSMKVLRRG